MGAHQSALPALLPLLLAISTTATASAAAAETHAHGGCGGDTTSQRPPLLPTIIWEGGASSDVTDAFGSALGHSSLISGWILEAHTVSHSTIIACVINNLPRGGGGGGGGDNDVDAGDATSKIEHSVEHETYERIASTTKPNNGRFNSRRRFRRKAKNNDPEYIITPLPKRLLNAARGLIGRLRPNGRNQSTGDGDVEVDHAFDELDQILEHANNSTTTPIIVENADHDGIDYYDYHQFHRNVVTEREGGAASEDDLLETLPPLPQGASSLKGWKQRSLRSWINKAELKFLSSETSKAIDTIRSIMEKFPDYGVVDVFGMYSPKDVIWSIVALSRLQRVSESDYFKATNKKYEVGDNGTTGDGGKNATNIIDDEELLGDLAHYCAFANAAYGWKGFAFCGRFHFGGNNRVLIRSTGIHRRDIVTTNWHSKANRPAYYVVRDMKRKAIVLGIRGTASARDILTDLCASAENFIVEDGPEIGCIDDANATETPPPLMIGRAHKGMIDGAKSVARMTGKTISDELDANPDFSLVIVGHSLGGGVGAALAALWKQRFPNRVLSIGYGNPCVFPFNNTRDFESVCISVMGEGDPFGTISLGHIADVTKALSQLCQDRGLREEILKRSDMGLLGNAKDMTQDNYEWCVNAMAALRKQMDSEKLLPPGRIYHMSGPLIDFQKDGNGSGIVGGDATTMLKSVDAIIFNELKLHARMFDVSLHIPLRYHAILKRLAGEK